MIKKKYATPDAEVINLTMDDVLAASTVSHDPQDPVVSGVDDPIEGDL
jgi:hypothetical protein